MAAAHGVAAQGRAAQLRRRDELARSLRARVRVRVPVRVRGLRPDAARGAGRRRADRRARHAGRARGLRRRRRYVAGGDVAGTAAALRRVLSTPPSAAREQLRARRRQVLARYSLGPRGGRHARSASSGSRQADDPARRSSSSASTRASIWSTAWRRWHQRRRRHRTRSSSSTTRRPTAASQRSARAGRASGSSSSRRNLGFAAANNVGIRATASELILLLNSDTDRAAGRDRRAGRAAGRDARRGGRRARGSWTATGAPELSFGPMISPLGELRQKAIAALYSARRRRRWRAGSSAATRREHYVDWVSGACLLVRRADAEASGLLDERYFLYTEDVDFCAAIRARGRRVLFTPAAEIVHLRGRSRATAPAAVNAAYRRSQLAFYEKHHPGWAPVLRALSAAEGAAPAVEFDRIDHRPRRAPDCQESVQPCDENRHRCPQAARLRHRHLRPQPAAAPGAAGSRRPSTSCSAAPTTARLRRGARRELPRRRRDGAAPIPSREQLRIPLRSAPRRHRPVSCAALRAAAARRRAVGRHDPRLHPPAVSAVPAEPARRTPTRARRCGSRRTGRTGC